MHIDAIVQCYAERGHIAYAGEGVTQLQHAWQCASLAGRAGASPSLRLAAWLHDLGHLLTGAEGTPTLHGLDDAHEQRAAAVLVGVFGAAVAAPVALHVLAKRCLVTVSPGYLPRLSADSVRSLALQGGAMEVEEVRAFLSMPSAGDALRLRVWDDAAKDPRWCFASTDAALEELRLLVHAIGTAGTTGKA